MIQYTSKTIKCIQLHVCVHITCLISWSACCVEHSLTLSSTQRNDSAWNTTLTHRYTHLLLKFLTFYTYLVFDY